MNGCVCRIDLERTQVAGASRYSCIFALATGSLQDCSSDFGSCPDGEVCRQGGLCESTCPIEA